MLLFYTVCAVVGGTILVVQFVLSLVGMEQDSGWSGDVHDGPVGDAGHGDIGPTDDAGHGHFDAHDSSWFFRLLSFRSVIAALAFFGLGGGLGTSLEFSPYSAFVLAVSAGVVAMLLVAWVFRLLMTLREEGTLRIGAAVGQPGTVYLNIPGRRAGAGKVTVTVQNQSLEFEALTNEEGLLTGTPVIVTGVVNDHTLEVMRETK
jgi:hypothetical protein